MNDAYKKGYHETLRRVNSGNVKRTSILTFRCIARGWVERTETFRYVLTEAGREQLALWEAARDKAD